MGVIARIRGWIEMVLSGLVKEEFKINPIVSVEMDNVIRKCADIYAGNPEWISEDDGIKTINFAKAVCSETARLAMLGTSINIDGSERAEWLQEQINSVYYNIREWIEYGCAYGTIVLKPDGDSIEVITPDRFIVTDIKSKDIVGAVFVYEETAEDGKEYFTRLEWHRFDHGIYTITNKCYKSTGKNGKGHFVPIEKTPWSGMIEHSTIENVDKPLFSVFRTPHANNVDIHSGFGLPIFWDALEELKDLDIAYSRNSKEIYDSQRIVLLDSDRMLPGGGISVKETVNNFESTRKQMGLPNIVKNVYGNGAENFYQEINPDLNTDERLKGINALLSQIGYKIGFSNGYFVFNESSGIQTATGVEADQQRTIQFVKDVRDQVEKCMKALLYALDKYADMYDLSPVGVYEAIYDFGDITYNREEDRARWYGYVVSGKIPFWYYLVKFEGFTEEDAKAMEAEAKPKPGTIFGEEE